MFTREELKDILGDVAIPGPAKGTIKGISTDSRAIKPGELFIPLKGNKFDGRRFIPDVLKKGAFALDIKNGLKALQKLAARHRSKFTIPVIGVTGSVGKTTTKEMIASILLRELPVLKNEGNKNNEIGVPLTLLKLTKKHRAAVIEMGMQKPGDIRGLVEIARPTIAVITNIGEAHLKYMKSRENIAAEKAEIFALLNDEDGAVINQDDEFFEHLKGKASAKKIVTFGIIEKADVSPKELEGIKLSVPGEHNIYNALAAIAAAKLLGIKPASIKTGLEKFRPADSRFQVINCLNKVKILNDTYNASPQSMEAALKLLAAIPGNRRRIAILGDMLELGTAAKEAHRRALRTAQELRVDRVLTFGKNWPASARPYRSKSALIRFMKKFILPRDIILVKGSRGMKMEEIVRALISREQDVSSRHYY